MDMLDNLRKTKQNDGKTLTKFFKYIGKIKSADELDAFLHAQIKAPLLMWVIDVLIIRAFLIFITLECLSAGNVFLATPDFTLAEGISLGLFLLVELKKEFWRKE
jgi:hypothetical protein